MQLREANSKNIELKKKNKASFIKAMRQNNRFIDCSDSMPPTGDQAIFKQYRGNLHAGDWFQNTTLGSAIIGRLNGAYSGANI